MRHVLALALLFIAAFPAIATGDQITLTGTIRDFKGTLILLVSGMAVVVAVAAARQALQVSDEIDERLGGRTRRRSSECEMSRRRAEPTNPRRADAPL